ncbi:Serine/threonine protein kinase [Arthrobacter sp. ok909]|uniref:serine/threonine-protein kinase n=1 Tax=Arthrobacter sp. ok909 TaxID=1761746 RepID=UPI0008829DBB|nr:serine/threonine-protein kinase [Arthrobacter sp. ok909]SDP13818.1 Serine/threonine protein kinase [Arthrobacter sp. ok909]
MTAPAAARPVLTGSVVPARRPTGEPGSFLIHELLGRGATATVFRGTDLANQRPVAVKVAEGPDGRHARRIHEEARILSGLDHPAVVAFAGEGRVPDGSPWAGRPFLVEEFVFGGNLAERIHAGPGDPGEVAGWAAAALSGLGHVHARGLVHQDIKPANILLSSLRRSPVRIADFGIAAPAGTVLEPGMSSGTVHYMSPQQANGGPADPATDVYALGLVLLECLTAARAFPGTYVESLVARTLRGPAIPQGLGPRWVSLLAAMTAMEAADRPSAEEASAAAAAMVQRPVPPLRDYAAGLFAGGWRATPPASRRRPLSPVA